MEAEEHNTAQQKEEGKTAPTPTRKGRIREAPPKEDSTTQKEEEDNTTKQHRRRGAATIHWRRRRRTAPPPNRREEKATPPKAAPPEAKRRESNTTQKGYHRKCHKQRQRQGPKTPAIGHMIPMKEETTTQEPTTAEARGSDFPMSLTWLVPRTTQKPTNKTAPPKGGGSSTTYRTRRTRRTQEGEMTKLKFMKNHEITRTIIFFNFFHFLCFYTCFDFSQFCEIEFWAGQGGRNIWKFEYLNFSWEIQKFWKSNIQF